MRPALWAAALSIASFMAGSADAQKQPSSASLLKGIEKRPWNEYYTLAAALYREGQREEAAKWLYVAQIRAQADIRCNQDRGGAQLRGSLNEVVGRDINEYLYGSVARAVRVIDSALEWDAANPNPRLPLPKCAEALEVARGDKLKQREWTLANADEIRKGRADNGLANEPE